MKRAEFEQAIVELLDCQVDGLDWHQKVAIIQHAIVKVGTRRDYDQTKKGQPWTDDELRFVLQHAPTRENCLKLAYVFKRGYGSIEQIFRWAATSGTGINQKRPDDAFIQQIKRIAKQVGWRAT